MSSMSNQPVGAVPDTSRWRAWLLAEEMWASLAIVAMWIAVAVTSVWGPDLVSSSAPGGSSTTVPSGVAVALFATIGTWAVARRGFARGKGD